MYSIQVWKHQNRHCVGTIPVAKAVPSYSGKKYNVNKYT